MSRRTRDVSYDPSSYVTDLRQAITRYLPRGGLALVGDDRRLRWVPRMLVTCAILTGWDVADLLTDAFEHARAVVAAMYPSRRRPGDTYAGFAKTLARRGESHLAVVAPRLRRHVRRLALKCSCWRSGTRPAFGVDGSKVECPMTAANEKAFGTCGKKKTGPQQFLTTVFHVGTGLVWDFRRGDARASERAHLLAMLATLPLDAILLADAGFVGYDFFKAILGAEEPPGVGRRRRRGRTFLIRVGANVRLLTKLGWCCREHDGIVYLWPDEVQKKKGPPLVLRLITLVDGRNRKTHLLTAVLDRDELGDAEAGELYRRRWGVEVIYRSLKQTMGKRKLRSASPANAAAELDWAVVGLWLLGLMGVERVVDAGGAPGDWGVASGLRAVQRAIESAPPPRDRRRRGRPALGEMLAAAVKDKYERRGPKTARHWPHKKKDKPPGDPKARTASEAEIKLAAELRKKRAAA